MANNLPVTPEASAIGEVQRLTGRAVAVGLDGSERQLVVGDLIYAGENVRTIGTSTIVVALKDGSRFDLGRNAEAVMDEAVVGFDTEALRVASQLEIGEIQAAIAEQVDVIVDAVRVALELTPPELSADIVDQGIVLTGGGALLKNLDQLLVKETGMPIIVADDPLSSVVLGSGRALDNIEILKEIAID